MDLDLRSGRTRGARKEKEQEEQVIIERGSQTLRPRRSLEEVVVPSSSLSERKSASLLTPPGETVPPAVLSVFAISSLFLIGLMVFGSLMYFAEAGS